MRKHYWALGYPGSLDPHFSRWPLVFVSSYVFLGQESSETRGDGKVGQAEAALLCPSKGFKLCSEWTASIQAFAFIPQLTVSHPLDNYWRTSGRQGAFKLRTTFQKSELIRQSREDRRCFTNQGMNQGMSQTSWSVVAMESVRSGNGPWVTKTAY